MPGISNTHIAIGLGTSGGSWTPNKLGIKAKGWFREIDEVAGEQPNKMDEGATVLTIVSGTGLNKVYQLPAGWVACDTDYCWWKTDGSLSTTDGNRLIAYDFARTIVKYDSVSPYTLREIVILEAGAVLTTAEENSMRDYMQLSIWWSDISSNYGRTKGNRAGEQSHWVAESVTDIDADALFTRMLAAGEDPDAARKTIINNAFVAAKAKSFWAKLDVVILLAAHGEASHLMNWKGTDYTFVQSATKPTFTIDRGGKGNGTSSYYRTQYTPNGTTRKYKQDDSVIGFYSRTAAASTGVEFGGLTLSAGVHIFTRWADNTTYMICNSSTEKDIATTDGSGMFALSRTAAANYNYYKNKSKNTITDTSTLTPTNEFYVLADRRDAITIAFSDRELSFFFIGGGLTETEIGDLYDIFVDGYLDSVGAKL